MQRARTIRQKKHVMPYESKKSLAGFLFVSIWVIGFIFFFLLPFLQSVRYSFSDIVLNPNGGYTLNFIGWKITSRLSPRMPNFFPRCSVLSEPCCIRYPSSSYSACLLPSFLTKNLWEEHLSAASFLSRSLWQTASSSPS